ncbi:hypothetical protein QSE00_17980 [Arenibacter sp. M-2]|uniref:hypothetical protein n=1 Tax=Arenibacter sp. M-2 TaxID=3053612 RepID=UPI00256FF5B5|nr:hypothetical protein [Arenibacter sp. M-2]MDL5513716.1 hypothetical protein [Arenibacter sp. M-2]|tara:strand:+ start:9997 stop:10179 length:183 start_codon:yes stop_codon:yes gene_type:complete
METTAISPRQGAVPLQEKGSWNRGIKPGSLPKIAGVVQLSHFKKPRTFIIRISRINPEYD